jgi:hypothetical protein
MILFFKNILLIKKFAIFELIKTDITSFVIILFLLKRVTN